MSTFVFVHGGGSSGWDWHLVAAELRSHGHVAITPDLPTHDASADLGDYADTVARAAAGHDDVVVVGHSLGGFTAPLVCDRLSAQLLVMVTAMIPNPGESVMDWWSATGQDEATADSGYDEAETFFHDVPDALVAEARRHERDQTEKAMVQPWPGTGWPDVPTRFVLCRDDRLFPAEWMRGLVERRLGVVPDEMDGGHYVTLSRPVELARRLMAYLD